VSPARYRRLIAHFGLSQVGSARFLGYDPRTVRRWVAGELEVPKAVAMLLELMVGAKAGPEQVEKLVRQR
jgi:hypothetical protein